MQSLTAECPKCLSRDQGSVGDTFVGFLLVYHLRCNNCGYDFEAVAPTLKIRISHDTSEDIDDGSADEGKS